MAQGCVTRPLVYIIHCQLAQAPWRAQTHPHPTPVPLATGWWVDILLAWTLILRWLCNMLSPHSKWECWELVLQQRLHHRQKNPGSYLIVPHFAIFGHTADFLSSFAGTQHQYLPSLMPLGAHVVPETAPHTEEHLKGAVSFPFFFFLSLLLYDTLQLLFLFLSFLPTTPHLPSLPDLLHLHFPSENSIHLFYTDLLPFRKSVSTLTREE